MKVGIITMISDNYGNRLQNYALQEVLTEIGNFVETLNNPWNDGYSHCKESVKSNIKKLIFYIIKKPSRYKRKINFERFNRKYIVFSKFWLNQDADRIRITEFYDVFVCGSDQIWNSEAKEITQKYFAGFADKQKRASYAASFGIETVVEDRREEFAEYLSEMNYISVREYSGLKIVENLTGRKAVWHLDPTLLLEASKWDGIATKTLEANKFIFCYFLGEVSETILKKLAKYTEENDIKVYSISNERNATHNNVGPDEFLSLIKNAEFVLTDSFHGTAFSIIYHKPFYTFSRSGVKECMDTRVMSLLNLLGLEDRFEPVDYELDEIGAIDFHTADLVLNREREKAIEYLTRITRFNN